MSSEADTCWAALLMRTPHPHLEAHEDHIVDLGDSPLPWVNEGRCLCGATWRLFQPPWRLRALFLKPMQRRRRPRRPICVCRRPLLEHEAPQLCACGRLVRCHLDYTGYLGPFWEAYIFEPELFR